MPALIAWSVCVCACVCVRVYVRVCACGARGRYEFLVTLLPFPGTQLSTDDFDGVLYNATNLAVKGIASIAAYGYIVESYTGELLV